MVTNQRIDVLESLVTQLFSLNNAPHRNFPTQEVEQPEPEPLPNSDFVGELLEKEDRSTLNLDRAKMIPKEGLEYMKDNNHIKPFMLSCNLKGDRGWNNR